MKKSTASKPKPKMFSLYEFLQKFPDEESATTFLENRRWGTEPYCPHCGSLSISKVPSGNPMPYRCKECRKHFSVRTGSVLAESKLPLHKWLMAIYMLHTARKGVSSIQMAKELGITQKSAWFLNHRIREAMKHRGGLFCGEVEVDEVYVGGKEKNRHASKKKRLGRGPVGKQAVFGIHQRNGGTRAFLIDGTDRINLHTAIVENVKRGATVYSDCHCGYVGLNGRLTCIDLFCGIGGFHVAAKNLGLDVVFASDIDEEARAAYRYNYGMTPAGDIVSVKAEDVPDHDILLAGFPCQPFSIIGSKLGTADPRGTLFLEILRIVRVKKPIGIVLENVKQLATAQHGSVLRQIIGDLRGIGYSVDWRILNALHFGLPQKRERVIIVATLPQFDEFPWPTEKIPMKPLSEILEKNPDQKHFATEAIRAKRHAAHKPATSPAIWHENKAGHISSYPWSCALRAGASYNYLLVDGERRLTPREMLRLQGFPDTFKITCNDSQTRKQAGNAVPVPLVEAAIKGVLDVIGRSETAGERGAAHRTVSAGATTRYGSF